MRRLLALAALVGCGHPDPACQVNADCPAGACGADRTCHAVDAATGLDGSTEAQTCKPNHDGTITRDELVIVVPTSVTFLTSTETPVDLHGTVVNSVRHWDLTGALAGDHDVALATAPVTGTWFGAQFPDGQFTTPITGATDLLGVYAAASDRVAILGAASLAQGLTQTELTYDPPVDAFVLPLHAGQHWAGQSTVTGTAQGIPAVFTDSYTEDIDAEGEVATPYGTFPVLRARLALTHTVGFVTQTTVTYAFVAECFGTVATITGRTNDTTDEFTTAAEVRRLEP